MNARKVSVADRVFRIQEVEPYVRRDGVVLRKWIARGPRGAEYGCWLNPDSSFVWFNLRRRAMSVPPELARLSPREFAEVA